MMISVLGFGIPDDLSAQANATGAFEYVARVGTPDDGAQRLLIEGNRLFVANKFSGLQIIDITNMESPKILSRTPTVGQNNGLAKKENFVFIADIKAGLLVYDVTNQKKPKKVAEMEMPEKGEAWDVQIKGNYAFIAGGLAGLVVVDITDPISPKIASTLRYDREWDFSRQVSIAENTLYIADRRMGFHIVDISNPAVPNEIKRYSTEFANAVFSDNKYVYVADGPGGLLIIDVSDPVRPKKIADFKLPGHVNDVAKYDNYVYASVDDAGIRAIDVSNPSRPKFDARYDTPGQAFHVVKQDVMILVADLTSIMVMVHNKPPVIAKTGNKTVAENQTLEFKLKATDPDGNPIVFSGYFLPPGAEFNPKDSTFRWTPTFEQSGLYEGIIFGATEITRSKLFARDTISITVTHVNRAPSLPVTGNYTVDENKSLTYKINPPADPDKEDFGKLTVSLSNPPQGALFNPDSLSFTWIPTFEQSGEYSLNFTVKDPSGLTDTKQCVILVNHIDRPPVFADLEDQTTDENKALSFAVTANDPDKEDAGKIEYAALNLPPGASFERETRTFTWTPTYDQSGKYQGIYFIARDAEGLADTLTLAVTVNHVNRPPVLASVAAQTVDEVKLLTYRISAGDPDAEDAGKIKIEASGLPEGALFDAGKGQFTWTPTYEQSGDFVAVFKASDPSGATDELSVKITVNNINRPPTIAAIEAQITDENKDFTFVVPEGQDPDKEDAGKLTYSIERLPQGATFDATTRTVKWLPTYDQSGVYEGIKITVKDMAGLTASTTLKITVNHVNRPPVLDAVADASVDENKPITFVISGSDPDKEDAGKLTFTADGLPAGAAFDPISRRFTLTPTFDQSGTFTIKFTVTDPSKLSDIKSMALTVLNVNRLPKLAAIQVIAGEENKAVSIVIPEAEDADKEDAGKLVYKAESLPEGATFDAASRTISWTPTYEQSGNYSVKITVTDVGGLTDTKNQDIRISHVNRPPVMNAIADQTADEGKAVSFTVEVSDPDKEDANRLTVKAEGLPTGAVFTPINKTFAWTPNYEQAGEYTVTFTVNDGGGMSESKTAKIKVNNVNRKPALTLPLIPRSAENKLVSFALTATDPDKDDAGKLTFSADGLPSGAEVSSDGKFSWTPTFDQSGSYTITFKVKDAGGLEDTRPATLTIDNVNRPPKLEAVGNQTTDENKQLSFTVSAIDDDKTDKLTYTMTGAPVGVVISADGNFSWTPTYDQAGTYTITVKVTDGSLNSFDSKTVTITVANVNRPPKLDVATSQKVDEGKTLAFKVSFSDPDKEDAGKLVLSADGTPTGATFSAINGQFNWITNFESAGEYTVTFKVKDASGLEENKAVTITVANINRAPKLTALTPKTVKEGNELTFKLSATDPDTKDKLVYTMTGGPSGAELSSDGDFKWTPQAGQAGSYTVTFTVSDGTASDSKNATITVQKGSN